MSAARAADHRITLQEVQQQVDEVSGLPTRLHDPRWASVYRLSHRMVDRFRVGRVLLVADAAHVHSPTGGQTCSPG